jgi:hypothetical protein
MFCSRFRLLTCGIIDIELEVGDVEQPGVLMHVHHVRVEPGEVQHVLREACQGHLQRQHLAERPVVGGRSERRRRPLADHAFRHHCCLHLSKNVTIEFGTRQTSSLFSYPCTTKWVGTTCFSPCCDKDLTTYYRQTY